MENATEFAGREVITFEDGQPLADPTTHAYRIAVEYDAGDSWVDLFATFLARPGVERVEALLVGAWDDATAGEPPDAVIEALVGARQRLPALRALFFGDISMDEAEISWIQQGDLSPLLSAYPKLRELQVRGGQSLSLGKISHAALERLVIETGGMDRSVVQQVCTAQLPELQHLELWLGDDGYGANTSPADLAPILGGELFPKLTSLALRNYHYADELAAAVAAAPVLGRIAVLDLSLGTLSDAGAAALLAAPELAKLSKLDLHHHFLSKEVQRRLSALSIEVDLSELQEADEYDGETTRFVAVGE
jgi:hypothetical protein